MLPGISNFTCEIARPPRHFPSSQRFLADLAAVDHSSSDAEDSSRSRVRQLALAWRAEAGSRALADGHGEGDAVTAQLGARKGGGGARHLGLLFRRSLRQVWERE